MKIATWNVNSINVRLEYLIKWIKENNYPEVICLQETKTVDEKFPKQQLEGLGYNCYFRGQKSYNGVAVLSKTKLEILNIENQILNKEVRVIHAKSDKFNIICVYIPNGQLVGSEKFVWKFEFLKEFEKYCLSFIKSDQPLFVCGDINMIYDDIDVYDPGKFNGMIMNSIQERSWLKNFLRLGLTDSYRFLNPDKKEYSWFDYITLAFNFNRGWRIDYVLTNIPATKLLKTAIIEQGSRGWERPSDHCPVIVEFELK